MRPDVGVLKQEQESGAVATIEGPALEVPGRGDETIELRRVACHLTESLFKRILRAVFPDQRKDDRHLEPPLVGYLGTLQGSKPYEIGDISLSGFCLLTDERWEAGTEMPVTLQRKSLPDGDKFETFTVQATVVRCGEDGVGFSIVLVEDESQAAYGNPLRVRWVTRLEMEQFLKSLKEQPVAGVPAEAGQGRKMPAAGAPVAARGRLKAAF